MSMRRGMKLLDLFCGAGGAAMGYYRAGFTDITGVDIAPQKRYPFNFIQADALEYLAEHGREYDVIHVSPECQEYSITKSLKTSAHKAQIPEVRALLQALEKYWIIENVPGAPMGNYVMLCGTMFELRVIRHRLFETSFGLTMAPATCNHDGKVSGSRNVKGIRKTLENFKYLTIVGNDYIAEDGRKAMGIDWMTRKELSQAIPPAYTEWIGKQLMQIIVAPEGV